MQEWGDQLGSCCNNQVREDYGLDQGNSGGSGKWDLFSKWIWMWSASTFREQRMGRVEESAWKIGMVQSVRGEKKQQRVASQLPSEESISRRSQ